MQERPFLSTLFLRHFKQRCGADLYPGKILPGVIRAFGVIHFVAMPDLDREDNSLTKQQGNVWYASPNTRAHF